MDEVDAALDNVNVRKVCSYIKYVHTHTRGRRDVTACSVHVCVSAFRPHPTTVPNPLLLLSLS